MGLFNRDKHKHHWRVYKAAPSRYVLFGGDATQVYAICDECKTTTRYVKDGWWTVDELNGNV